MKYMVLIGDGMSDEAQESLGGKTPLEAANTPHMDFIAANGYCGWVENVPQEFPPGSDVACLSIFGYNPKYFYTGRGPLEAASLSLILKEDQTAFRCNLVTVEDKRMKDFTAGHITTQEAESLIKEIEKKLGHKNIHFYTGKSYRHLMITNLKADKISTTPPHDIIDEQISDYLPRGDNASLLLELMEKSKVILANHKINRKRIAEGKNPATMIWLWGGGKAVSFVTYQERFGISGAAISAVDLIQGIARLAGLEIIKVPGATGFIDTNYQGKAQYALKALEKHDIVFVHIEAIDEASHMGDAKLKIKTIEDFDRLVAGTILEGIKKFKKHKLLLLPDHATLLRIKTHINSAVPFAIYSSDKGKIDKITSYSEKAILASKLKIKGHNLIKTFLK